MFISRNDIVTYRLLKQTATTSFSSVYFDLLLGYSKKHLIYSDILDTEECIYEAVDAFDQIRNGKFQILRYNNLLCIIINC